MQLHANAAVSLIKRRQMVCRVVEQWGRSLRPRARRRSVRRLVGKWVSRYRAQGDCGLLDRSSAPRIVANRTCERRIEAIAALRRLRCTGPEIAETLGMALSTVSGILTRIGLGRLARLGLEPAERYERARPASSFTSTSRNSAGSMRRPPPPLGFWLAPLPSTAATASASSG